MKKEGLSFPKMDEAERLIKQLDKTKESAKETLIEFLQLLGADGRFLEIGLKEVYENNKVDMPVELVEGALEILGDLRARHEIALVTIGRKEQQMAKMKKAGIDHTLFSRIAVAENQNKKSHYQVLMRDLGFLPSEIIVCGDRVKADLSPAKELGFNTVHIKRGRGAISAGPAADVDFTISQLSELKAIIKRLSMVGEKA
jgi:FMN phosphatase YigB (HAD superfamily)